MGRRGAQGARVDVLTGADTLAVETSSSHLAHPLMNAGGTVCGVVHLPLLDGSTTIFSAVTIISFIIRYLKSSPGHDVVPRERVLCSFN